jgi:hypothetical protein
MNLQKTAALNPLIKTVQWFKEIRMTLIGSETGLKHPVIINDLYHQVGHLGQNWSRSKVFRVTLVIVIAYTILRLGIEIYYLSGSWLDGGTRHLEQYVPIDLQVYLDAARNFQMRQDLYLKGALEQVEFYQYAPSYALALTPFLRFTPFTTVFLDTILHILAYILLYLSWGRIFHRLKLHRANELLAWSLPVWLIFSQFWGDLSYLNIYIFMSLLATLFIEAVLYERLGWSLAWLSIILQLKPQWAFAAAMPLLLGQWRFFLKLIALAIITYGAIVGLMMFVAGSTYVWQQYTDYFQFLLNMSGNFPWRGPEAPFLGYNHSVLQTVFYWLGVSPNTLRLATSIKILLLAPLAFVSIRHIRRPVSCAGYNIPQFSLDIAFIMYLGAFIWLDMVWELSLGIVVFTYLLATSNQKAARILICIVFLPYALLDFWQVLSYLMFGPDIITSGGYVLTDPSIHVPLIMIVILAFYILLLKRLWIAVPRLGKLTT